MTAEELSLGTLTPLHLAIPELAVVDSSGTGVGGQVIYVHFGR